MSLLCSEVRRQLSTDSLVILVYPLPLFGRQHGCLDQFRLQRAKGDGFKTVEAAEGGFELLHREHQVLDPNSVCPRTIQTRLVRADHSRFEGRIYHLRTNALRAFVHIQKTADPVPGPVAVAEATLP